MPEPAVVATFAQTSSIRVLLADDMPDIRLLLRAHLEADGRFDILGEAEDGREAVRLVLEHRPDAVILDLAMPVMDGLEAIPLIVDSSPGTKIVVLSGFEAAKMAEEALARGADAYLEKGTSSADIVEILVDLCRPSEGRAPVLDSSIGPPAPEDAGADDAYGVLAALVHELTTPLTVIQGFADTMQQRLEILTPEMLRECIDSIVRGAEHMANLIADFADARQIEINALDLVLEPTDIGALIRSTVSDLSAVTADRRVDVTVQGDLVAQADPTRVRQVLTNLVSNAARHTPAGSPMQLSALRRGDRIEVSVTDHGPGIPGDLHERVFQKFTRLSDKRNGTGLGLYISRGIARAHGGDVVLRDVPGGGSCFTLILPVPPGDAHRR